MEPRKQALVFMIAGALLLVIGAAAMVPGGGQERSCLAIVFCDSYAAGGIGLAAGLAGIGIGLVALLWGAVVWFVAPRVLTDEARRDPNRPPSR